ncbi:MAG: formylglycine-generating enzyme family protein [Planctomycetota bacterium]
MTNEGRATMTESEGWQRAHGEADLAVWLPGDVPLFFQRIQATDARGFRMGARGFDGREEPVHRVVIAEEFYLGTFPVTQAQYRAVAEAADLDASPSRFEGDLRPVEQVSWHDARRWCEVLESLWPSLRQGKGDAPRVRVKKLGLPSEAQWEYACRAATETDYSSGDGEAALAEVGRYSGNSGEETQPVGTRLPSAWGLYDMHGNVDEWCEDVYDANAYRKRPDGWVATAWTAADAGVDAEYGDEEQRRNKDPIRVIRGGSWFFVPRRCRSADRNRWRPDNRDVDLGFRVCLVPGPAEPEEG